MVILPSQELEQAIAQKIITADNPIGADSVQPASLDLRLGMVAWRVAASFLPSGSQTSVEEKVKSLLMHEIDLTQGGILEKGCVYVVPLQEELNLPIDMKGRANPKSSTGRLDIFARVMTDGGDSFDNIPAGFKGRLYAEISPRTFSVRVRTGDKLTQLRLMREASEDVIKHEPYYVPFTVDVDGSSSFHGTMPSVTGFPPIIGWRARKHAGLIDLSKIAYYSVLDYWEPVFARPKGGIILDPDDMYILATKEKVVIPHDYAAEMLGYDASFGEFRVHYAGFFDPGFGEKNDDTEVGLSRGVLEVRTHEVPFLIEEGQIVGRLMFERMASVPHKIYGRSLGSHYYGQGLRLAKQFAPM